MISAETEQAVDSLNRLHLDTNSKWLHSALQIVQSSQAKTQTPTLKPLSMQDMLTLPDEKLEWIWQDYIAKGDLAILTAYMKVGKSTFFYPLALSVARGQDFLDRPTQQGGVLILALEENRRDVRLRFQKLGVNGCEQIFVQSDFTPCTPEGIKEIREFAKQHEISLVIVDSLSAYWDIKDENNNAEVQRKLTPLRDLAHTDNIAVLLIHHESKYGGKAKGGQSSGDGRAIRGASALFGVVDQALSLSRPKGKTETRRVLKSIGRRSESVPELIIELWGDTKLSSPTASYGYKVIGTPKEQEKSEQQRKIKDLLSTQWLTIDEIAEDAKEGWEISEGQVREALKALHLAGKVRRQGTGAKNDPFQYRLPIASDAEEDTGGSPAGPGESPPDVSGIPFQGSPNPPIKKETNLSEGDVSTESKEGSDFVSSEITPLGGETKTNPTEPPQHRE